MGEGMDWCSVKSGYRLKFMLWSGCILAVVIFASYAWQYQGRDRYYFPTAELKTGIVLTPNKTDNSTVNLCKGHISVIGKGRLGNQMCQYAALMGIASRNRLTPVIASEKMALIIRTFRTPSKPVAVAMGKVKRYTLFPVICEAGCRYDKRTEDLHARINTTCDSHVNIRLDGYFLGTGHKYVASDHYFHNIGSLIRSEFIPKDEYLQHANAFLAKSAVTDMIVGIHIRRGDFIGIRTALHSSYFLRAIDFFVDKYGPNVSFVVATNGEEWAKEHVKRGNNTHIVFSSFSDYADDFALLYKCDHMILSFGTFSWWAGYLTPGIKIIPFKADKNLTDWMYLPPSLANRTTWMG